ncbi:MAG: type II secretion system protein [Bacilli bacterium]|nr:type II secretion system protein [Bacilli bacterium]
MKQKNGYTIPELLIVIGVIGVIALVAITKVSYAFSEINNPDEQKEVTKSLVEQAAIAYAKSKKEEYKKDEETYIFAKEVASAGFLFEKEEYNTMKIKISYQKDTDTFKVEVVE